MNLFIDVKKKLPGFDFEVKFETGQDILGILGASGSGKSMTLKCIAGLITPDSGKIIVNDRVLFDSDKSINMPIRDRKVGFLFQNYALFPHMTVSQNIGYALKSFKLTKRNSLVQNQIDMMQLNGLENRYPSQLSGGQQQRVALARALAVAPDVLLLDEPFSALDNHLRRQMLLQMSETLSTFKGITLFVTHNMTEAFELCNNLIIISDGKNIESGKKNDIFKAPSVVATANLTGCKNIAPVTIINKHLVHVPAWNCDLAVNEVPSDDITHVGIRARYLEFSKDEGKNLFTCWPAMVSDNPFSKIIYLKLNSPSTGHTDYNIQAELSIEEWEKLSSIAPPWKININPNKLFLMKK